MCRRKLSKPGRCADSGCKRTKGWMHSSFLRVGEGAAEPVWAHAGVRIGTLSDGCQKEWSRQRPGAGGSRSGMAGAVELEHRVPTGRPHLPGKTSSGLRPLSKGRVGSVLGQAPGPGQQRGPCNALLCRAITSQALYSSCCVHSQGWVFPF